MSKVHEPVVAGPEDDTSSKTAGSGHRSPFKAASATLACEPRCRDGIPYPGLGGSATNPVVSSNDSAVLHLFTIQFANAGVKR